MVLMFTAAYGPMTEPGVRLALGGWMLQSARASLGWAAGGNLSRPRSGPAAGRFGSAASSARAGVHDHLQPPDQEPTEFRQRLAGPNSAPGQNRVGDDDDRFYNALITRPVT